ncbi:putative protein kinase ISR1 KNAG_0A07560 [Huiozyma naganishii CBS 8797]|uniref:Protein kinase domain-containing protein n=1 Tax=Huiozyma naganishii (strain ATCC MYA-139 / BCRC 22969 / CBS 8797 / KCTC 17520 / NBRC 10181 / NCYC 3082 / Yp74L-3) TaxID=1071383 RepID=J7S2Y5_HUIN7|nr:hypothetical protein KNAG_0A07560 [Kazachstania naganishii CBS 8797]CCK68409.1 hypothetical protein KNAG_0A07560 [Kazachstania naganishii CBS 8797]
MVHGDGGDGGNNGTLDGPPQRLVELLQRDMLRIGGHLTMQDCKAMVWCDPHGGCKSVGTTVFRRGHTVVVRVQQQPDLPQLTLKFVTAQNHTRRVLNEAAVLYALQWDKPCSHVVQFLGVTYLGHEQYAAIRKDTQVPAVVLALYNTDLEQLIQRTRSATLPQCRDRWWTLYRQLSTALAHVHRAGVVHADIKTSNILVDTSTPTLAFKLADFTASFFLEGAHEGGGPALETTLEYSPQSASSGGSQGPTQRGDVYSLALCLLACITGREPYSELLMEKFHSSAVSAASTQWLINAISRDDPIALNVLENTHLYDEWAAELTVVRLMLRGRTLPLD